VPDVVATTRLFEWRAETEEKSRRTYVRRVMPVTMDGAMVSEMRRGIEMCTEKLEFAEWRILHMVLIPI
jgi:hypothetical protein